MRYGERKYNERKKKKKKKTLVCQLFVYFELFCKNNNSNKCNKIKVLISYYKFRQCNLIIINSAV